MSEKQGDAEQELTELAMARHIAEEAGDLALTYFRGTDIGTRAKGWRDVVTAADVAVEGLISRRLQERFPTDGIVAEEGTAAESRSGKTWFLDPIDGTLNFSRGLPLWCVSISQFDEKGPILGVIRDPVRRETFSAQRDAGAWCNGDPMRVSDVRNMELALIHVTVDFHGQSMRQGLEDLHRLAPSVLRTRNIGSAALALAYVAAGHFDALLHRHAHAWDYGAGVLMIEEAGGVVTDMAGAPYQKDAVAIVAAASAELAEGIRKRIKP